MDQCSLQQCASYAYPLATALAVSIAIILIEGAAIWHLSGRMARMEARHQQMEQDLRLYREGKRTGYLEAEAVEAERRAREGGNS